jgi:hypothetical protein
MNYFICKKKVRKYTNSFIFALAFEKESSYSLKEIKSRLAQLVESRMCGINQRGKESEK